MMNEAELQELGEDINANGLRVSIVIWRDPAPPPGALPCLLDGRNRLDAMAHGGLLTVNKEGHLCRRVDDGTEQVLRLIKYNEREGDPYKLVASFNVYRRHLSAEWKRQLIAEVLRVDPAKSNRAIARELKEDLNVDTTHNVVGRVRHQEERRGTVNHVETRTDSIGRQQPATRKTTPEPAQPGRLHYDDPVADAHRALNPVIELVQRMTQEQRIRFRQQALERIADAMLGKPDTDYF